MRILRFFRMHAAYGAGEPDRAGYLACIDGRAGLSSLSAERVRMEMLKLLVAEGAAVAVQAMADAGLLLPIFGGVAYTGAFAAMIAVERALGLPPNAVRRLAALTVAVTEDAKRVSARLRLSNAETKALDSMGHRWWRLASKDEARARQLLYRLGEDPYRDRLMLAWARAGGSRQWRRALARTRNLAAALERAEISAEGGRFHLPRHCRGPRARPRADACGRRLVGRGFSAGCIRAGRDRRPDRRPFHPRSPAVNILAGFADISLGQLVLVGGVALFASIVGGLAGYGTGALMPLVLVPLIGAEPVVPIIAISAIITNISRFVAYFRYADRRRALIVIAAAALTTALGAYGYTRLTGAGAALVIGSMLILSVPLRRLAKKRDVRIGDTGLGVSAVGYGVVVGGTSGSGVILLSLLMASGLEGAAVIATDAVISVVTGLIKISVFGLAGVVTAQVLAFALLIGAIAIPGAFLAKAFVERMPVHIHTAILDAAVMVGGMVMITAALRH